MGETFSTYNLHGGLQNICECAGWHATEGREGRWGGRRYIYLKGWEM